MIPRHPTIAELEAAHDAWGCNCGPAALCAVTGLAPDEVRQHFGPTWPGYTNPTAMRAAAVRAGLGLVATPPVPANLSRGALALTRIQWGGPWCAKGRPMRAAYPFTHWIAETQHQPLGRMVYDVNIGNWYPLSLWSEHVVPQLLPKRADGTWWRTHVWELSARSAA